MMFEYVPYHIIDILFVVNNNNKIIEPIVLHEIKLELNLKLRLQRFLPHY